MLLIKLKSDNFDDEYMTAFIYEHIVLEMSSGDFGSHTATAHVFPSGYEPKHIISFDWNGTMEPIYSGGE